jgi:hypothetical protein
LLAADDRRKDGTRIVRTTTLPPSIGLAAAQGILSDRAVARDDETQLAAALRYSSQTEDDDAEHGRSAPNDVAPAHDVAELASIAVEICRCVESRLPGRVHKLRVQAVDDYFVLSGACHSYYVKQVAQHLAMNALDACLLGRLVNEIEVRTGR